MAEHPTLSEALQEAFASAPVDDVLLDTLELSHPSFVDESGNQTSIFVVRDYQDLEARLEANDRYNSEQLVTFIRYAFDLTLPDSGEGASKELKVTIDNVSHLISEQLDKTKGTTEPLIVIYRPYLLSRAGAGPEMDPPYRFVLRTVNITETQVVGTATFGVDFTNRAFPSELYTAERFPGLVG